MNLLDVCHPLQASIIFSLWVLIWLGLIIDLMVPFIGWFEAIISLMVVDFSGYLSFGQFACMIILLNY